MCTANPNCVAYYYKLSECHEANGIGLIGALPDSSTAQTVFIDSSVEPGNLAQMKLTCIRFRRSITNIQYISVIPLSDTAQNRLKGGF